MSAFLKDNRYFFIGFLILFSFSCFWLTQIETGEEVLYFQQSRTDEMTCFFLWITKLGEALPFVIIGFLLAYFRSTKAIIFIALTGAAVTLVAFLLKTLFAHPRPKTFFKERELFQTFEFPVWLDIHGGASNAFPSGHTMAAFALYALTAFFLRQKKVPAIFLLLIAALVGFSRIYLFQHFLKDVAFGAFLGVLVASILFLISEKTLKNLESPLSRHVKKRVLP